MKTAVVIRSVTQRWPAYGGESVLDVTCTDGIVLRMRDNKQNQRAYFVGRVLDLEIRARR